MPRRKSNLNNACSKAARRKRITRRNKNRSDEQTAQINEDQRIRAKVRRAQESRAHRDERLRQNVLRTRAAREQHIDTFRARERERQRTSQALRPASFVRLAFEYAPDINYSATAHSKIAIGAMDKDVHNPPDKLSNPLEQSNTSLVNTHIKVEHDEDCCIDIGPTSISVSTYSGVYNQPDKSSNLLGQSNTSLVNTHIKVEHDEDSCIDIGPTSI